MFRCRRIPRILPDPLRKSGLLGAKLTTRKLATKIADEESNKIKHLFEGILNRERGCLAQAITLVETVHPSKYHQAQKLLSRIVRHSKTAPVFSNGQRSSFRIGLSGPPGGGKSTFIETFGSYLTKENHRVAVLAVDPSSSTTGGSLLGDKTRMTELSRNVNAYIRPSPSSGTLGKSISIFFNFVLVTQLNLEEF